jgi:hypothetical protein
MMNCKCMKEEEIERLLDDRASPMLFRPGRTGWRGAARHGRVPQSPIPRQATRVPHSPVPQGQGACATAPGGTRAVGRMSAKCPSSWG